MDTATYFFSVLCFGKACYLLWAAYQVKYNNRTDIIRLGSSRLPGAGLLKDRFAATYLVYGVACAAISVVFLYTGKWQLGFGLLIGISITISLIEYFLIRVIEVYAGLHR